MLNRFAAGLLVGAVTVLVGCAATPPPREISLPDQNLDVSQPKSQQAKLVIFNDSSKIKYGVDNSGKINIYLDGKGVGQLPIDRYVIVNVSYGAHHLKLEHRDLMMFSSSHEIDVQHSPEFLRIYAKVTSNGVDLVSRPADFGTEYTAAY